MSDSGSADTTGAFKIERVAAQIHPPNGSPLIRGGKLRANSAIAAGISVS